MRAVIGAAAFTLVLVMAIGAALYLRQGSLFPPPPTPPPQAPIVHIQGLALDDAELVAPPTELAARLRQMRLAGAQVLVLEPVVNSSAQAAALVQRLRPLAAAAALEHLPTVLAPRIPGTRLAHGRCAPLLVAVATAAEELACATLAISDANTSDWVDEAAWRQTLHAVRSAYHGRLAFVATADSYPLVTWWQDVDVMGIAGPFTLGEPNASRRTIAIAWQARLSEAESLADVVKKPLWLFDITGELAPLPGAKRHRRPEPDVRAERLDAAFEAISTQRAVSAFFVPWPTGNAGAPLRDVIRRHWQAR
jgi:hypothetical protein